MMYRYDFPDQFEGLERTDFSQYSGNIVLWGAGKIGSITAYLMKQQGIKVLAIVDILPAKQGTKFCGLDVISPQELLQRYRNAEVVITTVGRNDVVEWLTEQKFTAWHDVWPLLLEFDFGDYSDQNQMYMSRMIGYYFRTVARALELKRKFLVNRLRVMVTSRCSLRCKECSVFVPYVQHPQDDSWEQIISDIKTFLDAVSALQEVELWGGEPLLHPNLPEIITALANEPRIHQISVITNGTILPDEKLIKSLKTDPRIIFRISCYGALSSKLKEAEGLMQENHIRCEIINYKTWYKNSEIKVLNETDEELRKKFNCCMEGNGIAVWRGKLCFCATLPFLLEAGAFPESDENYYDIRRTDLERTQMIAGIYQYAERANTDRYIDACRYCTGKTSTNFSQVMPVAEQTKILLKISDFCKTDTEG